MLLLVAALALAPLTAETAPPASGEPVAVLPPALEVEAELAALGRLLFADSRLSGDTSLSCASCHNPQKGWADGLSLARGYPGALYFRNTPTVVNSAYQRYAYWDGRLNFADLETVVRDHIAEAHFMQADGRLVSERLRQAPAYNERFEALFGTEPRYGGVLKAVAAYLRSLRAETALDRHLAGVPDALSATARRGLGLFTGAAGCSTCHGGALLSDGLFRRSGAPPNDDIWKVPERHITWRRFMRTLGVPDFAALRADQGLYAVTKEDADRGLFRTPALRGVPDTAPYMHNGSLATLAEVVAFYDAAGHGEAPLGLTAGERADLVAFLEALAFLDLPAGADRAEIPQWEVLPLGDREASR